MKSLKLALGGALLTAFLVYGASVASGPAGWGPWGEPPDPTGEILVYARITGVDGRDLLIDQPRDSGSLEVGDRVTVADDAEIYAKRGEGEEILASFDDLQPGMVIGMIVGPEALVRTVVYDGHQEATPGPDGQLEIILYFADPGAVATGNLGDLGYLKPVRREIQRDPQVLRAALDHLILGPLPEDGDVGRTVPESLRIVSISVEDGIATIDVSQDLLTAPDRPAGTLGSAVFAQSVVVTATQFPTVDSVLVLVEGEHWDDGHVIWDEPIGPEAFGFK